MIGFGINRTPPFLLEKIENLCNLLWQGKREYEQVASVIPDKDLRRTILTLAQESNQYACELFSQIQSLGGISHEEKTDEPECELDVKVLTDENEIFSFCKMNEKKMVSAYREILNESFIYEGLRKMIRYQLNGILCAFMQLKLLSSLRIN
jgi:hypothetical protein